MDNHYHLVVENSSGRLSEFFKQLNGRYGTHYRKKKGGKGYVFQNRFRSEIVQDESYAEIAEISIFSNVQMTSLGKLYQDARKRFKQRSQEVKHRED